MTKTFIMFFLVCTMGLGASAQVTPEAQTPVPCQRVKREIHGDDARSIEHLAENSGDKSFQDSFTRCMAERLCLGRRDSTGFSV